MTDIAKLGLEADSSQIRRADKDLKNLGAQSKKTEASAKTLSKSNEAAAASFVNMSAAIKTTIAGMVGFQAITRTTRLLADFGQTMSTVEAVSGATQSQIKALRQEAKELGSDTRFSATQAAEGMLYLSRAGFTADETFKSVQATLYLAQAGALDLGSAADIASNIMQGFQLEAQKSGEAADVLAFAANNSNTNVLQLGDAMSYVAPVAHGLGLTMQTTAAAIGALSDAGIQGSSAGTGLRRVLSGLENPTSTGRKLLKKYGLTVDDVSVAQHGLVDVLTKLHDAGITTGDSLKLLGDRGGPAFAVLASSIPKIKELNRELDNSQGYAKQVADVMDDNLNGALLNMQSKFEALFISLGDAGGTSALRDAIEGLAAAFDYAGDHADTLLNIIGLLSAALTGKVLTGFGALVTKTYASQRAMVAATAATEGYTAATKAATVATRGLRTAMALLGGPAGIALLAATAIYTYRKELGITSSRLEDVTKKTDDWTKSVLTSTDALRDNTIQIYINNIAKLQKQLDEVHKKQEKYKDNAADLFAGNLPIGRATTNKYQNMHLSSEEGFLQGQMNNYIKEIQLLQKAKQRAGVSTGSFIKDLAFGDILNGSGGASLGGGANDGGGPGGGGPGGTSKAEDHLKNIRQVALGVIDDMHAADDEYIQSTVSGYNQIKQTLMTNNEQAVAQYKKRVQAIRNMRDLGFIDEKEKLDEIERAHKAMADAMKDDTGRMSQFAIQASRNIQDTLGDTLQKTLSGHFDNILGLWTNMLEQMAAQAVSANLADQIFGKSQSGGFGSGNGWLGTAVSAIGSYFGGGSSLSSSPQIASDIGLDLGSLAGFATGGRPPVGRPSIVGEHGPELFVPDRAGTVVPNGKFGSAPNVTIVMENHGGDVETQSKTVNQNDDGSLEITLHNRIKSTIYDMSQSGELDHALSPYTTQRRGQI